MIQIKTRFVAVVVPLVFVAGIGLTMGLNLWRTTSTKEPARYTGGEFAGQANPGDIRGSYTFGDVVAAFAGVPLGELAAAFGVTENQGAYQVKNLEAENAESGGTLEIGTDSVRLFVARYLGLPYDAQQSTGLPLRAVEVIVGAGRLDAEQRAEVESRAVGVASSVPAAEPATEPEPAKAATAEHSSSGDDTSVKGKTTFKDLADWGVSKEELARVLGGEIGAPSVTVRDYCSEKGVEFSSVRDAIQKLVDAARR